MFVSDGNRIENHCLSCPIYATKILNQITTLFHTFVPISFFLSITSSVKRNTRVPDISPETTAWGLSYIACSTHCLQHDECNTHHNDNLATMPTNTIP